MGRLRGIRAKRKPKPADYWIARDVLLRLVPQVDGLIEIAVYVDDTAFGSIERVLDAHQVPNIEVGEHEIIRRGRSNPATNIFIYRQW